MTKRQKKKQFKKKYGKWSKYSFLRDYYVMQNAWDIFGKEILNVAYQFLYH